MKEKNEEVKFIKVNGAYEFISDAEHKNKESINNANTNDSEVSCKNRDNNTANTNSETNNNSDSIKNLKKSKYYY